MVVVDVVVTELASRLQAEDKMLGAYVVNSEGMRSELTLGAPLRTFRLSHSAHTWGSAASRFRLFAVKVSASTMVVVVVVVSTGVVVSISVVVGTVLVTGTVVFTKVVKTPVDCVIVASIVALAVTVEVARVFVYPR